MTLLRRMKKMSEVLVFLEQYWWVIVLVIAFFIYVIKTM